MTREEVLLIEEYCAEHKISRKKRLEELGMPFRNFYKEIFDWFDYLDGKVSTEGWGPTSPGDGPVTSLDRAIELIQRNTRHYAKRQLSYWGRDKDIRWMEI